MVHSKGYRARTRHLFAKPFRAHGPPKVSTYLHTYRVGDYVDIKGDGSVHKGMPHKYYVGKTGRVWNVTKRALGVEVNKTVRWRVLRKRIHVRIEHVAPSRCREDFIKRVKENARLKKEAIQKGEKRTPCKRLPAQPRSGHTVHVKEGVETVHPVPFENML